MSTEKNEADLSPMSGEERDAFKATARSMGLRARVLDQDSRAMHPVEWRPKYVTWRPRYGPSPMRITSVSVLFLRNHPRHVARLLLDNVDMVTGEEPHLIGYASTVGALPPVVGQEYEIRDQRYVLTQTGCEGDDVASGWITFKLKRSAKALQGQEGDHDA